MERRGGGGGGGETCDKESGDTFDSLFSCFVVIVVYCPVYYKQNKTTCVYVYKYVKECV